MKKVLMLGTGGTIASEVTPSGLAPALTSAELLRCVPEISSLCSVTCEELFSIDSTNVTPAHWLTIARAIRAGLFSFPVRDTAEPVQRAVLRPSGHCSRAGLAALQLYFHVRRDRRYEHLLHFQRCSRALLLLLARPLSGAALGLTAREPVLSDGTSGSAWRRPRPCGTRGRGPACGWAASAAP